MKTTLITSAFCAAFFTSTAAAAPGYMSTDLQVAHRDVPVPLHIWYPTQSEATPSMQTASGFFYGMNVRKDATPASGTHPVVVLSHGSGGNAVILNWLAARLADQGRIVVVPNHPGTTSRDSHQDRSVQIWERPADFRAALDWLDATQPAGMRADMGDVTAMGFSLGGFTAMALGGARADKQAFLDYCAASALIERDQADDCDWLQRDGFDLTTIDGARYGGDFSDPRISRVVAIDPALPAAMTEQSLREMDLPALMINLGAEGHVPPAVDVTRPARLMPDATVHNVKGAVHLSFLAECKWTARIAVVLLGEDPICTDGGDRPRAALHAEMLEQITAFLGPVPRAEDLAQRN